MKQFTAVSDVADIDSLVSLARVLKSDPLKHADAGTGKTIGLVFMNPSLRTRLSSQKAAAHLGMQSIVLNAGQESWALEFNDGAVMNGSTVEHIKDAAAVLGSYCDILAVRCFPSLRDRELDYSEHVLSQFVRYCGRPVISLESATRHPLQSLADLITIQEHAKVPRPKVVLTWAPHIKPLPQAVANSFAEWMIAAGLDLHIVQPAGYELSASFTKGATITFNQQEALLGADFVYAKSWSSFDSYGTMPEADNAAWMLTPEKMASTNHAWLMHCLPVRRNVEVPDALLDGRSLILQQAANRVFAAQAVMLEILRGIGQTSKETQWNEKALTL